MVNTKWISWASTLIIISNVLTVFAAEEENKTGFRQEKLFLVQLRNTLCQVDSSNGTCYLKEQCTNRGGKIIGKCQNGLGSCCRFELGCGSGSSYRSILQEREFTIKDSKDCNYEISKPVGYCQVKLDVKTAYNAPTRTGDCEDGAMVIEDSVTVEDFPVCGSVDRPLYASYGNGNRITLKFEGGSGTSNNNNYEVHVTHILCDSPQRVPDHCLLEYPSRSGEVQSFGFRKGWIAGQKYNVCIRKGGGKIQWTKCDNSPNMYADLPGALKVPDPSPDFFMSRLWGRIGAYGDSCKSGTSYVSIQGNRYCGNHFPPNGASSTDEPFILAVNMQKDAFPEIPPYLHVGPWFLPTGISTVICDPKDLPEYTVIGKVTTDCTFIGLTGCNAATQPTTPCDPYCFCKRLSAPTSNDPLLEKLDVGFCLKYMQTS